MGRVAPGRGRVWCGCGCWLGWHRVAARQRGGEVVWDVVLPRGTAPVVTVPALAPCHRQAWGRGGTSPFHGAHARGCGDLCRAVPCHGTPCHSMPCCATPCHAVPCHFGWRRCGASSQGRLCPHCPAWGLSPRSVPVPPSRAVGHSWLWAPQPGVPCAEGMSPRPAARWPSPHGRIPLWVGQGSPWGSGHRAVTSQGTAGDSGWILGAGNQPGSRPQLFGGSCQEGSEHPGLALSPRGGTRGRKSCPIPPRLLPPRAGRCSGTALCSDGDSALGATSALGHVPWEHLLAPAPRMCLSPGTGVQNKHCGAPWGSWGALPSAGTSLCASPAARDRSPQPAGAGDVAVRLGTGGARRVAEPPPCFLPLLTRCFRFRVLGQAVPVPVPVPARSPRPARPHGQVGGDEERRGHRCPL